MRGRRGDRAARHVAQRAHHLGRCREDAEEMQGRCMGDIGEIQGRYRGDTVEIWGRYRATLDCERPIRLRAKRCLRKATWQMQRRYTGDIRERSRGVQGEAVLAEGHVAVAVVAVAARGTAHELGAQAEPG